MDRLSEHNKGLTLTFIAFMGDTGVMTYLAPSQDGGND